MSEQWVYILTGSFLLLLTIVLFLFRRYLVPRSLSNRLPLAFMVIAGVSVVLVVGAVIFQINSTLTGQQGENAVTLAQINKNRLAEQLGIQVKLLEDLGTDYSIVNQVSAGRSVLDEAPSTERAAVFEARKQEWADPDSELRESIRLNPTSSALQYVMRNQTQFDQIIVTDIYGELAAFMGESPEYYYYGDQTWWKEVRESGLDNYYISPPYVIEDGQTPAIEIAVPLLPFSSRSLLESLGDEVEIQGMLRARLRLTNLNLFSEGLNQSPSADQETATELGLVHNSGGIWLFKSTDKTKIGQEISEQVKSAINGVTNWTNTTDETGQNIIRSHSKLVSTSEQPYLDKVDITIIIEQPTPGFAQVYDFLPGVIGGSLAALIIASVTGILFAWQVTRPIKSLTKVATEMADGQLDQTAPLADSSELRTMAQAFNSMTAQLRNLINSLEERIADRTHRLEIVATLGEQLNAILDPDDLLREIVNQTKENFGYYHTHIYLFDNTGEKLVVAAGTGSAGEQMMADGHSILSDTASLVARAACSGEIVTVGNVQEAEDWLPNPLLPDTRSEMAVPIIQKDKVIGVLDVQQDKINSLDESDANLLRSLANQVAVALSNAHLFTETTRAKVEAEQAREDIELANKALEMQVWQTSGQAELNEKVQGEQDIATLANSVIRQLCHYLQAQIGALYIVKDQDLVLLGSYAYSNKTPTNRFKIGEGLIGQAAVEKQPMLIADTPTDHLVVRTGFSETPPQNIMVFPFMYENRVVGVIELGTLAKFTPTHKEFMQTALNTIAISFNTAQARDRINELLAETQQQSEELQAQSEELRVANEELETQTKSLKISEAQLKEKQAVLDQQNRELKVAQEELETKADELALASKYKSEFLANMSHELRTPLNSLLILARMLADNKDGNLTKEQIESAQIIHSGGTDLLNLINDILDLSKVEAGQMAFNFESMPLTDLVASMRMQFDHVAEEKGLTFNVDLAEDLPPRIHTDPQRTKQVVKNLLSNAFKFTSQGSVSLNIYRPDTKVDLSRSGLTPDQAIAVSVIDTGIGMTLKQQKVIFEAFQQADGSTSRQYGGTGLGLSISRELVGKLGGQIEVQSQPDKGSTFILYLPIQTQDGESADEQAIEKVAAPANEKQTQLPRLVATKPAVPLGPPPKDDRDELEEQLAEGEWPDDVKVLLIIEDDPKFAKVVYDYSHQKGFKCLISGDGTSGLELVKSYQPQAIILDLNLPDMSGWEVLTALKNDPATRHIPIHIMSGDEEALDAYRRGAMGYLTKPIKQEGLNEAFENIESLISREIKSLLVVEDDKNSRRTIKKLLGGSDVKISEAERGEKALKLLEQHRFDCMILDLSLPDMTGFEVLNKMYRNEKINHCPVIVYTGRDLTPEENKELMQYADSVIVKGVKSPERLLDETALFLHRVVAEMPSDKRETIQQLYSKDTVLEGKNILIVDDDMRNSFALSKLLSERGIIVKMAKNGQDALELMDEESNIDLILMDIMMPVMDGYETIRRIRAQQSLDNLPILALTAKAMKGDREKCLAAGANDYLSKPIDVDRLFSMLRVWLYQ